MATKISIIVAHDDKRGIGKDNQLLWKIPADLKHFKEITMGHPIIMGRKTYESIGSPLPGRDNIVISRRKGFKAKGCRVVKSVAEAIRLGKELDKEEIFVIGGGQIYRQTIKLADKLYVTQVKGDFGAEVFFPEYEKEFPKAVKTGEGEEKGVEYVFWERKRD